MKWVEETCHFKEGFIKNYNGECNEGYFLEVDVQCSEKLYKPHNDLPYLPEEKKLKKVEKLMANLHDKNEYVIYIRNLKQLLNHILILEKVQKVHKFNQNILVRILY